MKSLLLRSVIGILLLLCLWATTLGSLELLPLHNDEGLHLRRAVEVWNGHPFWNISDGKIINHWLIAAFYPFHAPVFMGRIATILLCLIGLSAGYALAWRLAGLWSGLLAGIFWLTSPYLFFFQRLALSDAQAGALVLLALWLALLCAQTGRYRILTGLVLGLAVLFKFTAAPYVLAIAVVVLLIGNGPFRQRLLNLGVIAMMTALCFVPPLAYLLLRGDDFFNIALGWIGGDAPGGGLAVVDNFQRLWAVLTGFGTLAWVVILLSGFSITTVMAFYRRARALGVLLVASAIPFLVMTILGREVLPRHFVVALPLALVLAGLGFGLLLNWLRNSRERWMIAILVTTVVIAAFIPFAATAYRDAGVLPLPDAVRTQYITDHSAGYGLREAVQALPEMIEAGRPIIASMFPDSCRRANFYAQPGYELTCVNAPGMVEIEQALADNGAVYVLVDNAPLIGVDIGIVDAQSFLVGAYPRPGEEIASVTLWRLQIW